MEVATSHLETEIVVENGDLDEQTLDTLLGASELAWDIETTGLDWCADQIRTVQLCDGQTVVVVAALRERPERLIHLLEAVNLPKLFHHAMFDLRFMASAWGASPRNVGCTKIAAKLLKIEHPSQSLGPLVQTYLGVRLDKGEQLSDWSAANLSDEQLAYAAGDVWYLGELMSALRDELFRSGRWPLAEACFEHLPTRVELELRGFEDVFAY